MTESVYAASYGSYNQITYTPSYYFTNSPSSSLYSNFGRTTIEPYSGTTIAVGQSVQYFQDSASAQNGTYLGYYIDAASGQQHALVAVQGFSGSSTYLLGEAGANHPESPTSFAITQAAYTGYVSGPGDANAPCYCAGTLVRTTRGDVPIERLCTDDIIVTLSGKSSFVRWIGRRTIHCRSHPEPTSVWPVCIRADTFAPGRPARDLWTSPGHAICFDVLGEVLIPALELVNGNTIYQQRSDHVTYWLVELDQHEVMIAENQPAESYLDLGNRRFCETVAGTPVRQIAATIEDYVYPLHVSGPLVEAVRLQLLRQTLLLGWELKLVEHNDIHLVVDGQRFEPAFDETDMVAFALPSSVNDVWLVSNSAIPAHVPPATDRRVLGSCIVSIAIESAGDCREITLNDPRLCLGFHELEFGSEGASWRWTTGRARLPRSLFGVGQSGKVLRVRLRSFTRLGRWVAPPDTRVPMRPSSMNPKLLTLGSSLAA